MGGLVGIDVGVLDDGFLRRGGRGLRRPLAQPGRIGAAVEADIEIAAAGDFNAGSTTAELNYIKQTYIDAWPAARALGTATNYEGNCDGCTRNGRIDYVMASRGAAYLALVSARVFDTRDSRGVMASDHKPLLVTYSVR